MHVVKDDNSETGFRGLPPGSCFHSSAVVTCDPGTDRYEKIAGWAELLRMNHITKEDAREHGDAIIDILRFHQEQVVRCHVSFGTDGNFTC